MNIRMQRINLEIKNALSTIISQMNDKRLADNFISISDVRTSPDLYSARVSIAFLNDDEKKNNEILQVLNSSKGYIKNKLAQKIRLKRLPDLLFINDKIEQKASRIEELLAQISKQNNLESDDKNNSENND